ncbi:MAG: hypothetical protein R6X16_01360 [Anaerolineae bacterium]
MLSDVTRVVYASQSGAILPELRWYEEYVVTRNRLTLERRGTMVGTQVAAGSWEIAVDPQAIADLFTALEAVDASAIQRMEPVDQPDGGNTQIYAVYYAGDQALELSFDPGIEYTGGAQVTGPIDAFLGSLVLPVEARSRYKDLP